MPRRVELIRLAPTSADKLRSGDRVRFTYHEPTSTVDQARASTFNGKASIFIKATSRGETSDVFVAPDQTVWIVEIVGSRVEGV
jgi:hypothetical protein